MKFQQYLYHQRTPKWRQIYHAYGSGQSAPQIMTWDTIPDFEDRIPHITWYCGVEVHKKHILWAFYGFSDQTPVGGPILRCTNAIADLHTFMPILLEFTPQRFLLETTGIFHFHIAWLLRDQFPESQVVVMNARLIHRIISGVRKSDKSDVQKLALLARYNELLRHSYVPTREQATLRELTRMRRNYTKETTRIKNRIKKIFSMYGFNWEFSFNVAGVLKFLLGFLRTSYSMCRFLELCRNTTVFSYMKHYFTELDTYGRLSLPQSTRTALIFCFHSLKVHQEEVKLLEKQIYAVFEDLPTLKRLENFIQPMPGMSKLTRIAVLAEVGNIHRFPEAGDVAVYSGIAPRGGTSGIKTEGSVQEKQVQSDRPNRQCNRHLKHYFVQTARVIMRMRKEKEQEDDICRYACRFSSRTDFYFKYIFKIAAKWIRKMYFCLTAQQVYDPLVGLDRPMKLVQKTRQSRKNKVKRELYRQNGILKRKIDLIYEHMRNQGMAEDVIQKIRATCNLQAQLGGAAHG